MKKNKYKILVLSDLKKSTSSTLKSTVSLAKMIDGEIEFFHVKRPIDILEKENQLSAYRVINEQHIVTNKKIEALVNPLSEQYGVNINYSYTFGNVKNEIEKYINAHKPDVIVLGKRQSRPFKIIGDNIIQFIIEKYRGAIMIAANENALEPNKDISLGILNGSKTSFDFELMEGLMAHTQKPLKSFKIVKNSDIVKEAEVSLDTTTVEYVFEESGNTISNISSYMLKNNINLLCIDRGKNSSKGKTQTRKVDIKGAINILNVSLLLTGEQKHGLQ
jgi:nucleotide-binding universal stress UspA family protein